MTKPVPASLRDLLTMPPVATGRFVEVAADGSERTMTNAELAGDAVTGAAGFQAYGLHRRPAAERGVVLSLADPLEFVLAFFSVVCAGGIPIPAPHRISTHEGHRRRLAGIIEASRPHCVLTSGGSAAADVAAAAGVEVLTLPDVLKGAPETLEPIDQDIAYVQYTSGSVSAPKPIPIGHPQAIAQLRQAATAFRESPSSVSVNWVPLYHDMGLVTSVLRPLWSGYTSVLLDPFAFVRQPAIWPAAMTRWAATHTSAPDFGYALAATRSGDVTAYDLSSLRVARNAGEMVRPDTLRAFRRTYEPAGLRPKVLKPSYGMAEATLTVTTCPIDEEFTVFRISREAFRRSVAEPAPDDASRDVVELVSSGRPLDGTTIQILVPDGEPAVQDGVIGEVRIAGPQVGGGPLHTGDLGFLLHGELVLVGRSRERFQMYGENFYSGEIEAYLAANEPQLRAGRIAVFMGDGDKAQKLIVVAELRSVEPLDDQARAALRKTIVRLVSAGFGISVAVVELVLPHTLSITTSGKIQRDECRRLVADHLIPT